VSHHRKGGRLQLRVGTGYFPEEAKSLDEWRTELREIDAELLFLLQRRAQLAIDLLVLLRRDDLTLGELNAERRNEFPTSGSKKGRILL